MATSSNMPTITRKKRVPNKYNPNTYRCVAYNENDEPHKYPDVRGDVRAIDPLGIQLNKRPDMLSHNSQVMCYDLKDHRVNKPYPKKCSFLMQNSATLNAPVCYVETEGQPKGHWIAPYLPPLEKKKPAKMYDTVFRKDYCKMKDDGTCYDPVTSKIHPDSSLSSFHVNNLEEMDLDSKEKISYEHCYDSRLDSNYPHRGKRHGSFVWTKNPPSAPNWSYRTHHRMVVDNPKCQEICQKCD